MTFSKKRILVPGMAFLAIFAFAPVAFADIDEEEDVAMEESADGADDLDGLEDDAPATEEVAVEAEETDPADDADDAEPVAEETVVAEEEAAPAAEEAKSEEAAPAAENVKAEEAKAEELLPEEAKSEEAAPATEEAKAEELLPEEAKSEKAAPAEEVVIVETAPAQDANAAEVEPIAAESANEAGPTEEEQIELESVENRNEPSVGWRVGMAVLMWLPNRLLDLADCFSLGVGLGLDIGFNAQVTQLCRFGASAGNYFLLDWTYHRQIGSAVQTGWDVSFLWFGVEDIVRYDATGTMKPYWIDIVGIQMPFDSAYASECRDYWAIGAEAGLFWNVRAYIHPVEIADFICGIFFIDVISDDDLEVPYSAPATEDSF